MWMDHKGCTFIMPRLHVPEINRDYTKIPPPPSSSITEALLQHSEEIKEELHFFTLLICLRLVWKKALFFLYERIHAHAPAAHKPAFTLAVLIW